MVRALDDGEGRIAQKMGAVKHSSFGIGVLHFAALGRSLPMCRYLVEDLRMDVDDICPAGESALLATLPDKLLSCADSSFN